MLLHDTTSHRRNTPLRSSLVGRVAVAVVAAVVGAVPQGMNATSVPIPSAPEDSRSEADDSVSPPPGAVTTSPPQVPPASEPEHPQPSATAEANPQADLNPISGDRRHPCGLTDLVCVPHNIGRIDRIRTRFTNPGELPDRRGSPKRSNGPPRPLLSRGAHCPSGDAAHNCYDPL